MTKMNKFMYWFYNKVPPFWLWSWWVYLFEGNDGIRNIICRARGHRCGVIWFTCSGLEPDMHCRECGEDLQ